jgi:CheY-like chemotaxis protein
MTVCDVLRDEGFQVIEAADPAEALRVLEAGAAVDALLTDIRMPGPMDGLQLAAAVRALRPDLPILAMSTHIAETVAAQLSPFAFIAKPFESHRLIARLRAMTAPTMIPLAPPFTPEPDAPAEKPQAEGDEAER